MQGIQSKKVSPFQDGNNALDGTPMGDYLKVKLPPCFLCDELPILTLTVPTFFGTIRFHVCQKHSLESETWLSVQVMSKITTEFGHGEDYTTQLPDLLRKAGVLVEEMPEPCCGDPEICVESKCVTHPECGGNDTMRTKPPDEHNISEFWCYDCGEYFTAINP